MLNSLIALSAIAAFVAVLFLSLRIRPVVQFFGGIASQYRLHHYLGVLTMVLIVLHIATQAFSFGLANWRGLVDFSDGGLAAAWVALALFTAAFTGVWIKKFRYRVWRTIHLLFVPAYMIALLHIGLFVAGVDFKFWFCYGIGGAGLAFITAQTINHFVPFQYKNFSIAAVRDLGERIYEIDLSPENSVAKITDYPAGQIVYVRFDVPQFTRGWHPFSVASCRIDTVLRLVVKSFGHDTQLIYSLQTGQRVSVAGPYTEFTVSPGEPQVWIAGGIGVAPFLGMARCFKVMPYESVQLLYFVNSSQELTSSTELDAIAQAFPNFRWKYIVLPRGARISPEIIAGLTNTAAKYLVCGPQGFMRDVRKTLVRAGISSASVHTEEFSAW